MIEKPPERVIAERKNAWKVVSQASISPNVSGLSYSSSRNTPAPTKNRMTVVITVSLACSDQWRTWKWWRHSVKITGKPIDPRKTPAISTVRKK